MLDQWRRAEDGASGVSWLKYMGFEGDGTSKPKPYPWIEDIGELNRKAHRNTHLNDYTIWSYGGCVYLAEMMPEEYLKWSTLYRLGAVA